MKKPINGKKAIEQPQVIVYVLFVIVLTIAGIYVAFTQLGGVDITFQFQDYASRLNTVATKLMFTPECYAIENSYYGKDGSQHYQVSSGIINWTRFNKTDIIDQKCLSSKAQVWVELKDISTSVTDTIWSCPGSSCTEPSPKERSDSTKWKRTTRSFLVLIQNETKIDKGVLTLQIKE